MLFHELIPPTPSTYSLSNIIRAECGEYLRLSEGLPLFKTLPSSYGAFKRVKVRFQKAKDPTSAVFEAAFGHNKPGFRERVVITYPTPQEVLETHDLYYIFPVDGFRYMFSPMVRDSNVDIGGVVNTLIERLDFTEGSSLAADLLQYSYQNTNLVEGLRSEAEILLFDLPNFLAVRVDIDPHYNIISN